jgi:hypothetical protein
VNIRISDRSPVAVAVKAGVSLGAREITRNDPKIEAVGLDQVKGVSRARNKSEDPTVSVVRKEVAIGRAAEDTVNEKANAQAGKEENDPAVSLGSHGKGANRVNRAKASLTAALATRVAHQDQDGKIAIDVTEAEVEAQETTAESEFVTQRTSHMAT